MDLIRGIKPVSWLKDHAPEILEYVETSGSPFVITRDGEAKAVIIDIASWEKLKAAIHLPFSGKEDVKAPCPEGLNSFA